MRDGADAIAAACAALSTSGASAASETLREAYPFRPMSRGARRYPAGTHMRVFLRDSFIDRYTGRRLVFPGVLRRLVLLLPEEMPFHSNWAMDRTHQAFWELFPTLDHVVPVTRGGSNGIDNLVSTSQLMNSAKANWTLEELQWTLHPPGSREEWDGLTRWFLDYAAEHATVVERDAYLSQWRRNAEAATRAPGRASSSRARASVATRPSVGQETLEQVRRCARAAGVDVFSLAEGDTAEQDFARWRRMTTDGYFTTRSSRGGWMLYRPECSSLAFDVPRALTARPKVCATEREPLLRWAECMGVTLDSCSRCRRVRRP